MQLTLYEHWLVHRYGKTELRTLADGCPAWLDDADLRLFSGCFEDCGGAVEGLGEGG